MNSGVVLLLLFGAAVGLGVGRVWAENRRAVHDMRKTWDRRKDYRDKD